jgi:hypothetical protein
LRGRRSRAASVPALKAKVLDADGSVIEEAFGWVLGDLAVKATGLSYRVSVLSFEADADQGSRT